MKPPIQEVATSLGKENLYRRLRYPQIIFAILLVAIGAVAIRNEFVLTGREQARIIEEVRRSIRASYVDAGRAQEIDRALADRTQRIRHFSFSLGPVLAFSLTENLRGTAHDRHLGVMYSPFAIPEDNGGHSNPAEIQRERSREVSENFGFEHVEVINGNMRNLKRATVVGEQTLGGANPGMRKRLSRHFWMFLPTMRAVSPITGTNWDGVGVQPDVSISADQALSIAVKLAAGGA